MVDFSFLSGHKYQTSSRAKITEDNIKKGLLQTEVPLYIFLGYSNIANCSKAMSKVFLDTDKRPKEKWEHFLRRKCGLVKCSSCGSFMEDTPWNTNVCKSCAGKWAKDNKEKVSKYKKEWYAKNKDYSNYKNNKKYNQSKRRVRILERSVDWDQEGIRDFYEKCPEGYHVDHIIPLKGKKVSGLHVLANLQYLPAEENLRKGNKW